MDHRSSPLLPLFAAIALFVGSCTDDPRTVGFLSESGPTGGSAGQFAGGNGGSSGSGGSAGGMSGGAGTGAAGSACQPDCAEGSRFCDGACIDVTGDAKNCGSCGNTCAPSQGCVAGSCPAVPCPLMMSGLPLVDLETTYTADMVSSDLNGDGRLDLAIVSRDSRAGSFEYSRIVSVMLGLGNGTFTPKVDYAVSEVSNSLVVADLNGDGALDLVTGGSRNIDVLLGNGDGTFASAIQRQIEPASESTIGLDIDVRDLNGDGKVDLAIGELEVNSQVGWTGVLLGNGDGSFGENVVYPGPYLPLGVAIADIDVDGKLDIVTVNDQYVDTEPAKVSVLLGNGDGTFGERKNSPVIVLSTSANVGDFNEDDLPDLVIGRSSVQGYQTIGVLIGNGDGSFQPEVEYQATLGAATPLGDVDGDGHLDIVATGHRFGVQTLHGNGDGTFTPSDAYSSANGFPVSYGDSAVIGDFNGDGRPDVVTATNCYCNGDFGSYALSVLLGGEQKEFLSSLDSLTGMPGDPSLREAAVADLDSDDVLDVVAIDNDRGVVVALGAGDGTFTTKARYEIFGNTTQAYFSSGKVLSGDFDGDGVLDLVTAVVNLGLDNADLAEHASRVVVLLGAGDGTFTEIDGGRGLYMLDMAVSDLNADGILDLVASEQSWPSGVGVLLGNGDGTFAPEVLYSVPNAFFDLSVADLNLDDRPDVVIANGSPDGLSIFFGVGDGTLATAVEVPSDAAAMLATDLNGDDAPDLVTTSYDTPTQVKVLLNAGDGTFPSETAYPALDEGGTPTAADIDGDGTLDVVIAGTSSVSIFHGLGDGTLGPRLDYAADMSTAHAGDFNSDGKTDLLWTGVRDDAPGVGVLLNSVDTCQ